MIRETLKKLGLNEKEITIYLALLSLGNAPASVLGQRTKITRSTAQYTSQKLVKKGLIRSIQKNNTFIYTPESPDKLLYLLDQEKKVIAEKTDQTNRIIGELKSMINPQAILPKVRFFEGKDGLIDLYREILELRTPIDSFEDKGEMAAFIPEFIPEFIQTRIERKIFNRVICPAENTVNKNDIKEFRETRFISKSKFPFSCDIKICKDLVSIFSFDKNTAVGIAIQHQDIAKNFHILFNFMWNSFDD